jgi:pimeloyl-ACP methyl ester carboxylesterase
VSTPATTPRGLHPTEEVIVTGLATFERRVASPEATLICVHGGLDRGGSFARLARRSERFDVLAYDRRGYQASRGLTPLSLEAHIDDLLALSAWARARGPVVVLGHSYGGVVAYGAAVISDEVASVVVGYETPVNWLYDNNRNYGNLRPAPGDEAESFFRRMVSDGAWERLSDAEKESRRADGPALVDDLLTLRGEAPFSLADIRVPSTYVYGDSHRVDHHRLLAERLESVSPLMRCRQLTHAGHGAHLSTPDQLLAAVTTEWDERCA